MLLHSCFTNLSLLVVSFSSSNLTTQEFVSFFTNFMAITYESRTIDIFGVTLCILKFALCDLCQYFWVPSRHFAHLSSINVDFVNSNHQS
jgi:hypothetical protein